MIPRWLTPWKWVVFLALHPDGGLTWGMFSYAFQSLFIEGMLNTSVSICCVHTAVWRWRTHARSLSSSRVKRTHVNKLGFLLVSITGTNLGTFHCPLTSVTLHVNDAASVQVPEGEAIFLLSLDLALHKTPHSHNLGFETQRKQTCRRSAVMMLALINDPLWGDGISHRITFPYLQNRFIILSVVSSGDMFPQ